MAKALRNFRFVIIVLGLLILASAVSAKTGIPIQGDEESPRSLNNAFTMQGTAVDRLKTSYAVNAASDTLAPSFKSMPLVVTHTTVDPFLRDMVDLDSDGDIDFLGYTSAGDELFWWENDGNFGFSEHIIATEHDSSFVEGFDMDGDSDMDIVTYVNYPCPPPCINPDPDEIYWWENDGSESFTQALIYEATLRSVIYSPEIVDLDKDGDGDLVIGESDDDLSWIENTDTGWQRHYIDDKKGIEHIVTGDYDSDNDVDIAVAYDYTHPTYRWVLDALYIWENDGSMNFPTSTIVDQEDRYVGNRDLKSVDFDDDGDLDFLSSNGDVEWWENLGELDFSRHPISTNSVSGVFPGNLEGDGDVDVFYRDGPGIVMEKLGTGDFQRRSLALANPPQSMFGDLDQDGVSDLVAFSSADGYFEMLEYADVTPAGLPFYDGFEDRYLGNSWENLLSDDGEVLLQSDTLITGTQTLHFAEPEAEIILYLDLAGEEEVDLSYLLANEDEPYGEDGLYISADGIDWHLVASRTITTTLDILQYEIDLDEAADLNGLTFNDSFRVKFSLGLYAGGYWLDEVSVSAPGSPEPDRFATIFLPMVVRLEGNP